MRESLGQDVPPETVATLEIRLLGPLEILARGRAVNVGGSKRQSLLALLALRRDRVVAVDGLMDALWGENLPAAPRNALQHHVARLRTALGREAILASPDGYALRDATVDALRFEELLGEARAALHRGDARAAAAFVARAQALWRGPALHGLTDTAWFSAEARRLEALRVDALEERFEAALAIGEHREIVSALRRTLEENPFRERLWGQLMLALYRSGRQADALEIFQEARQVLTEELALEPTPELKRLQEAILAQDPAIAPVHVEPERRRGNLPSPSTSFVDREEELARVVELLREHRLVTLAGPPGVGKTRLALEAVRSLDGTIRDGAWLVEFVRAGSEADVVRLVAQAVDARGAESLARVVARLADADAILVFDACEHVIEEAARVASAVLTECPGVRVLATSREVLHVAGEVRISVEPLALPDPASGDRDGSPAVELFRARARAARPGFELTAEAAPLVTEISRRVDGLPLAIELAAARVNVLGLTELLSLVEQRLALLEGAPASDDARAALGTLVEWSYDLLHGDEKTLLHQLAVHRGGASLASLVAVAAHDGLDEMTVTNLLGALVDKSIVFVSFPADDARYDLLDTVRDYVVDRLDETGRLRATRAAHAEHFAALAESARTGLRGQGWREWVRRLELDHDNLLAALEYAHEAADAGVADRLGTLGWYFTLAERVSEGRRFLELARETAGDDAPVELRLELLAFLSFLATEEQDFEAAVEAGEGGLAIAEAAPGAPASGLVRATLALAYAHSGDLESATRMADEARVAFDAAGDDWGRALSSLIRAGVAATAGDVATAAAMTAAGLRQCEAIGYLAFQPAANLFEAWVAERRRDRRAAAEAYRRAFDVSVRAGFPDHASFALSGLGSVAFDEGDLRQAEDLFRRALAAVEEERSAWTVAHARVRLADVLAAGGHSETAERLYRRVVAWSESDPPHHSRETQFLAIAGSPAEAALLGLARLADARGDAEAAEAFRSRADTVAA
ncbi:MAG TPA: BTAD domain-containing putative transcriptional regulator [Gaiellaceae bacterium]|nr:BTAD domain-containing putative transcriptional regulator [Gaiellaceae bacterium]